MKKLIFALVLLVSGLTLNAQPLNSIFWEVKAPNGKVSHLLGTYHLMGGSFIEDIEHAPEALGNARAVMVEMIMDSSALMQASMLSLMPGKSLGKMTDSLDYLLLKQKLEPLFGTDLAALDMLKPMVLSTQYSLVMAQKCTPKDAQYSGEPLDFHLVSVGKRADKEILALETMEEQMSILFGSQTPEEQLEDLLSLVKDSVSSEESTKKIIRNYLNGDLDAMYEVAMEFEESMGDMDALLKDRNVKWIPQLEEQMTQGGLFVAVGALHLPGEYGVINLLKEKGYTFKAL